MAYSNNKWLKDFGDSTNRSSKVDADNKYTSPASSNPDKIGRGSGKMPLRTGVSEKVPVGNVFSEDYEHAKQASKDRHAYPKDYD